MTGYDEPVCTCMLMPGTNRWTKKKVMVRVVQDPFCHAKQHEGETSWRPVH